MIIPQAATSNHESVQVAITNNLSDFVYVCGYIPFKTALPKGYEIKNPLKYINQNIILCFNVTSF